MSRHMCCDAFEIGDAFTINPECCDQMRDVTRNKVYTVALIDFLGLTFVDDANQFSVVHGDQVRMLAAARHLSAGGDR